MIADVFLEIMSDNVSNADQNGTWPQRASPNHSELPPTAPIQWMALRQRAKATLDLRWR